LGDADHHNRCSEFTKSAIGIVFSNLFIRDINVLVWC
jgi:hypothetical protein